MTSKCSPSFPLPLKREFLMTFRLLLVTLTLSGTQSFGGEPLLREVAAFRAAEAHQGVAVDQGFVYAVSSREVAKYGKRSGKLVKKWPSDGTLKHLNSGDVLGGKPYAAHSTWPTNPPVNSIQAWDTESMTLLDPVMLKHNKGAFNWLDRLHGHWYGGFASYGSEESVSKSTVVRFTEDWQVEKAWHFPREVVRRFLPGSNSGAAFGPDGLLHVTGHDRAEIYALRIPHDGKVLELVKTVPAPIEGQGVAWDRSDVGIMYGIRRRTKEVVAARVSHTDEFKPLLRPVKWTRHPNNPVLPLGASGSKESRRCMNPWVMRKGDEYRLYYSGAGADGIQRICMATAPVESPEKWERRGPLFDVGKQGAFDARWCVLPHVVKVNSDKWHLYYTSNSGNGIGLSSFPGIGLAVSSDGETWQRYSDQPLLTVSNHHGDPDAIGMAGGSVIRVEHHGKSEWRFYYTGCPTIGQPLHLNQQKTICLAVSADGITWVKKGALLYRDPKRDYENIGVAGPVVHRQKDGLYRMWYSAIGTRWGYYSICYAESDDGLSWRRGPNVGDNLQLAPQGDGWERQMVEYPSVIQEGDHLRLFYCGNGYGSTGIGTAIGLPLLKTRTDEPSR